MCPCRYNSQNMSHQCGADHHMQMKSTLPLKSTCRSITGCLEPTKVDDLCWLGGIGPPYIRRRVHFSPREFEAGNWHLSFTLRLWTHDICSSQDTIFYIELNQWREKKLRVSPCPRGAATFTTQHAGYLSSLLNHFVLTLVMPGPAWIAYRTAVGHCKAHLPNKGMTPIMKPTGLGVVKPAGSNSGYPKRGKQFQSHSRN